MAKWMQHRDLTTFRRVVVLIAVYFLGGLVGKRACWIFRAAMTRSRIFARFRPCGLIRNFTKLYLRHFDVQINPIKLTILNRLGKKLGAVFNHRILHELNEFFWLKYGLTH